MTEKRNGWGKGEKLDLNPGRGDGVGGWMRERQMHMTDGHEGTLLLF